MTRVMTWAKRLVKPVRDGVMAFVCALLLATVMAPNMLAQTPAPLRAGILVRPDTVAVGDPFVLIVTVEVPNEASVQWPMISDSSATVAMRAPTRVTKSAASANADARQETAEYALAAWNVGDLPVGLSDVLVRTANDVRNIPLNEARVMVMSVLPGDTTLHVPQPPRALFPQQIPWWERWWPAALVVALLAALWWLWRRRKARVLARPPAPVNVYERAIQDFARVERMALIDVGERSRAVALSIEVLRTYLAARVSAAKLSLTSEEVTHVVRNDARIPEAQLSALLLESDVMKFARPGVTAVQALHIHREARRVVDVIEEAEQIRVKALQAAQEKAKQQEAETRKRDEERARRKSRRPKAGAS